MVRRGYDAGRSLYRGSNHDDYHTRTWPHLPVMLSVEQRPATAPIDASAPLTLRNVALVGLVASLAIVIGAVLGGRAFVSTMPGAWFFGPPGSPLGSVGARGVRPPVDAVFAVYGGLLVLAGSWLRLLHITWSRPGIRVRRVAGVIGAWALPLLAAPPLFSRDIYSYAAQGEMVSHHIDPYLYGPGVLGATPFSELAGRLWANTPSPYGPTFLWLDGIAARLAGHQILPDLLLLRLLELVGVALMIAGLPTLANALGRDPAGVVALGVGSPLVLMTLVGGAHNDALMVGLLIAGLAVARRFGPVPGIVLCALAAGVKAPAVLGVVFIGWNWAGPGSRTLSRVKRAIGALGIASGVLGIVSWLTGIGWGWLVTILAPTRISTGVTPVDDVARVVTDLAHLVGMQLGASGMHTVLAVLALLVAAVIGCWLLVRSPLLGVEESLGLALLVLVLLSPILWAWYMTWGLVVLAPVATGNLRRLVIALSMLEAFIGVTSVSGIVRTFAGWELLDEVLLVLGLGAVAFLVWPYLTDRANRSGRTERAERADWIEQIERAGSGS